MTRPLPVAICNQRLREAHAQLERLGWYPFGTHVHIDQDVQLEFSTVPTEDGLPAFEKVFHGQPTVKAKERTKKYGC